MDISLSESFHYILPDLSNFYITKGKEPYHIYSATFIFQLTMYSRRYQAKETDSAHVWQLCEQKPFGEHCFAGLHSQGGHALPRGCCCSGPPPFLCPWTKSQGVQRVTGIGALSLQDAALTTPQTKERCESSRVLRIRNKADQEENSSLGINLMRGLGVPWVCQLQAGCEKGSERTSSLTHSGKFSGI